MLGPSSLAKLDDLYKRPCTQHMSGFLLETLLVVTLDVQVIAVVQTSSTRSDVLSSTLDSECRVYTISHILRVASPCQQTAMEESRLETSGVCMEVIQGLQFSVRVSIV